MKKYPFLVIAILVFVVSVSGCVSNEDQKNVTTYSQNGVTFNYPSSWQVANTTSPNAVVAVADPKTVNTQTGSPTTLVVIQKVNTTGSDLQTAYNANYANFFNDTSKQRVSEGNITVGGMEAIENIYIVNESGIQKEMRAIWLTRNNEIYVILCSALQSDFESEQSNFDTIINSFKVQ